jgi:hypothetical protein
MNRKSFSFAALLILLIVMVSALVTHFQVRRQLISPLIPMETVKQIAGPYWNANFFIIDSMIFLLAVLFHIKHKFTITVIICASAIVLQEIYVQLFYGGRI